MAENEITPGDYKIVSIISEENPPTSVNYTKPAWQIVHLNGPVTTWVVRKEGKHYHLSLSYPFTGVEDEKVIATIHQEQNVEWVAEYKKHQNAFTISPANDLSKGWTVADESPHAQIDIRV